MRVYSASDIEAAIAGLQGEPAGGLVIMPSTFTGSMANRKLIIALAAKYRVPAVYPFRHWVAEGGLVSYGVDGNDLWPRAAGYVDRILRGAKPQELPVQLPIKFELCINLRAAKALGLDVPAALITISDAVIE
jgi:putative ABC transport system substrate-binding protein